MVEIYCDGACSYNPGPGGWAVYCEVNGVKNTRQGSEDYTTNNRMEQMALLNALLMAEEYEDPCTIYIDSAYALNPLKLKWYITWRNQGWRRGKKLEPVKNQDLWELIVRQYEVVQDKVTLEKVKAHADNLGNNIVDRLAVEMKKKEME